MPKARAWGVSAAASLVLIGFIAGGDGPGARKKPGPTVRGAQATTRILRSDVHGMRVRVLLPRPRFVRRRGGGRLWTQLVLPGTHSPTAPGKPEIPVVSNVLAVPEGARLIVEPGKTRSYTLDKVRLFPAQPDPVDAVSKPPDFGKPPFIAKPFAWNRKAYRRSGLRPSKAASGEILGRARDLTIASLRVPAAQYDARRRRLKVLVSVDVRVLFKGGAHTFSDKLASPWEEAQRRIARGLLNASAIVSRAPFEAQHCGSEALAIFNPATVDAFGPKYGTPFGRVGHAGLGSSIAETGNGPGQIGTTPEEIRAYIRALLNDPNCIHPSYVTIVGDDDLVPTFKGIDGIPSDLGYSLRDDADLLPDVAVGRILGERQVEIEDAFSKIGTYVGTEGGRPLHRAIVAAPFGKRGQVHREFAEFAGTVSKGLIAGGTRVDRIGRKRVCLVPTPLREPCIAANGRGLLRAAWNDGRFLVIHRGHGWSDGWEIPRFTTRDVDSLAYGSLLPFVISVDCSTAAYDRDERSFAQELLVLPAGGAVGVFGNTRNSPVWHNSQLALGLVDALVPTIQPNQGGLVRQRPGDALIIAKLRLAALSPPNRDRDTRRTLYLWHYFGLPSIQMRGGGKPLIVDESQIKATFVGTTSSQGDASPFEVLATIPRELTGEVVALESSESGGSVVGKAIVPRDGSVRIRDDFGVYRVLPGSLHILIDPDEAKLIRRQVEGIPKAPTSIEQTCPPSGKVGSQLQIKGVLHGGPLNARIQVTFTPPNGGDPIAVRTYSGTDGVWWASVTPAPGQEGTWTVTSTYEGTSQLAGSSAEPCQVVVSP